MPNSRFYGKYRAKVANIEDPEERGRIKVIIPSLTGKGVSNWCDPCIPVAYDSGGDLCLPTKGETVWVEFEEGDMSKPVWSGGWFSKSKSPVSSYSNAKNLRVISFAGCKILMNKATNTMTLSSGGSELVLNAGNIDKLNQLISQSEAILTHITHPIT